jgi:hypothetical protein
MGLRIGAVAGSAKVACHGCPGQTPACGSVGVGVTQLDASGSSGEDGNAPTITTDGTTHVEPSDGTDVRRWTSARVALLVFVGYLVIAFFVLLKLGSFRWFVSDDFMFLADRSATNLGDLFRPYNQHWVTVPLLIYRALYAVFGIRTYLPYQILVVALHLAICALLRVVMRRSGVVPWLATVVAATFVLFGPGEEDILFAFQISFNLAVAFGLIQLILSDHPGPIDRRDWLGLGAGALAIMCSGEGPGMVIAVGVALLLKRGWKQAAFHTVPLGIAFGTWYIVGGASLDSLAAQNTSLHIPTPALGDYLRWLWTAMQGLLEGVGHFGVLEVLLVVILVGGWLLAWLTTDWKTFRSRAALPLGLAVSLVVVNLIIVPQRFFFGIEQARSSRYLGVVVALSLPAFAFAANAIVTRWRWSTPAVFAVFLIPIPWNIAAFTQPDGVFGQTYYGLIKEFVSALPTTPLIHQVPRSAQPDATFIGEPGMTAGWILDESAAGKFPPPATLPPERVAQLPVKLGVTTISGAPPPGLTCRTYTSPITLKPKVGDTWFYAHELQISPVKDGQRRAYPVRFSDHLSNPTLQIGLPDLELLVEPTAGNSSFELCT